MALVASQLDGQGSVLTGAGEPPAGTPGGPFPGFGGAPPAVASASNAGAAATASRSDHTHEGVASMNGAKGIVGYAPVISCANVAALAALPTLGATSAGGYDVGQQAFVVTTGFVYVLQAKPAGVVADNYVAVATSDDATRLWIKLGLFNAVQWYRSDVVDCATVHTQTWGTDWPLIGTTKVPIVVGGRFLITNVSGTHSQNVQLKVGSNAAFDNITVNVNALVFGPLNAMVATGQTKNFTINWTVSANNTALTGFDVAPTISITQAIAGTAPALSVRGILGVSIVDAAT